MSVQREVIIIGIGDESGWAVVRALRGRGCRVAALYDGAAPRTSADAAQGMDLPCDTTDSRAVEAAMSRACDALPCLEALVCLAEHDSDADFEAITMDEMNRILEGNLTYAMRAARHAMQVMKRRRQGAIVLVAPPDFAMPRAGHAAYALSFGGLEAFTRSCAMDARAFHARVNCLVVKERGCEGFVRSIEYLIGDESAYITGSTLSLDC